MPVLSAISFAVSAFIISMFVSRQDNMCVYMGWILCGWGEAVIAQTRFLFTFHLKKIYFDHLRLL